MKRNIFAWFVFACTYSMLPALTWAATSTPQKGEQRSEISKPSSFTGPGRRGLGVDFNLDFGIAPVMPTLEAPSFSARLSARADAGILIVREPLYIGVGMTGGLLPSQLFGMGPYASIAHLWTGLWASAAIMLNQNAQPVGSLSVGWSIFGTEIQAFPNGFSFIGKIRIPIGLPVWAIRNDRSTRTRRN